MGDHANSISPLELIEVIGTDRCPTIYDVRRDAVYAAASTLIPTARWRDTKSEDIWRRAEPGADIVVYCVHGHEVSQAAAERLTGEGLRARYVEGGIEDYVALGGPTMTKRSGFDFTGFAPTRWVTRARPKIDRIACPWLIRRFIDPSARTFYVAPDSVTQAALELDAIPFDVDGVEFTHRGERCSFDTVIDEFGLDDPALRRLADIVRGADTARLDIAPPAAGLLAISLGLSAIEPDDHAMLGAGMRIYDALYGWCRHAAGTTDSRPAKARAA